MITITIHPQTPAHIAVLADAMTKLVTDQDAPAAEAPAAAPAPAEAAPAPKATRARKPAAAAVAEPQPSTETDSASTATTQAAAPTEETATAPSQTTATTSEGGAAELTLEIVRAKLAALSQAGKADKVKGLIAQFGVAKLTDIKAEQYGDLMAKAEAL